MGLVAVRFVVDAEDRRSVAPAVRLPGGHHFLAGPEPLQVLVNQVHRVVEACEQGGELLVGGRGAGEKPFAVVPEIAEAGTDVDARRVSRAKIVGILHQVALDKTPDQAGALFPRVNSGQEDGGESPLRTGCATDRGTGRAPNRRRASPGPSPVRNNRSCPGICAPASPETSCRRLAFHRPKGDRVHERTVGHRFVLRGCSIARLAQPVDGELRSGAVDFAEPRPGNEKRVRHFERRPGSGSGPAWR